jgi:hypothetical protein
MNGEQKARMEAEIIFNKITATQLKCSDPDCPLCEGNKYDIITMLVNYRNGIIPMIAEDENAKIIRDFVGYYLVKERPNTPLTRDFLYEIYTAFCKKHSFNLGKRKAFEAGLRADDRLSCFRQGRLYFAYYDDDHKPSQDVPF